MVLNDLVRKARIGIGSLDGEGTESNPYKISEIHDLQAIQHSNPNMNHFEQTGDIDATGTEDWNEGKGFNPIAGRLFGSLFDGEEWSQGIVFDGNGYKIDGLHIHRPNTVGVGLFSGLGDSTVKNVNLVDCDIRGYKCVGGIVGKYARPGIDNSIENCFVEGRVQGAYEVGGIAGRNMGTLDSVAFVGEVEYVDVDDELNGFGAGTNRVTDSFELSVNDSNTTLIGERHKNIDCDYNSLSYVLEESNRDFESSNKIRIVVEDGSKYLVSGDNAYKFVGEVDENAFESLRKFIGE